MANLSAKGKIHKILPVETNEYKGKSFSKQSVILDCTRYDQSTGEEYPNFPAFEFFGKGIDLLTDLNEGDIVEISFSLNGRNYLDRNGNEKNFTGIRGWKVDVLKKSVDATDKQTTPAQPAIDSAPKDDDDLPF